MLSRISGAAVQGGSLQGERDKPLAAHTGNSPVVALPFSALGALTMAHRAAPKCSRMIRSWRCAVGNLRPLSVSSGQCGHVRRARQTSLAGRTWTVSLRSGAASRTALSVIV
jgi:hypothetical protein